MTHDLSKLIDRKLSLYVVATGAGAGIQDEIWKTPGCSAFFKGASFPYAPEESIAFAGVKPQSFVSLDFAIDLACAAYKRAINLQQLNIMPVGLAVTASVASVKEHRGDHRAHIVCMTPDKTYAASITLEKGSGPVTRAYDGNTVDSASLNVLMESLGARDPEIISTIDNEVRKRFFENPVFWPNGRRTGVDAIGRYQPLFPGAFDPPHEGHEGVADAVRHGWDTGEPLFAICSTSPHKGTIDVQEMLRRAKRLGHRATYFTQGDPLYLDKARKHPGRGIIIGADALLRMLDPHWTIEEPAEHLKRFLDYNSYFYVFGREVEGTFVTAGEAIDKLPIDPALRHELFRPVTGRWDVSSTKLRGSAT